MSDPYIGEIRMIAFDWAPLYWAFCNGQQLPIVQNQALFAVIGTTYGGNGQTNFNLPNLQARVPIDWGTGPSLSPRAIGINGGAQTVTLTDLPVHTHPALGANGTGPASPTGATWGAQAGRSAPPTYFNGTPNTTMNTQALGLIGGSGPHNNMQPYLVMNFVIALEGIFPVRG